MALRIALIDNYDSYSQNLVHLLALANANHPPETFLADAYSTLSQFTQAQGNFDAFILSPGPGNPTNDTDFSNLQRQILSSSHPIFAVCLGHQALCHLHGSAIQCLPSAPAHGIISEITLSPAAENCPLFHAIPPVFNAVRYHSLVASSQPMQSHLIPTATTIDIDARGDVHRLLMAVTHRSAPHFGVQFHPESICTQYGSRLALNFVSLAKRLRLARQVPLTLPNPTSESAPLDQTLSVSKQPTLCTLVRKSRHCHVRPLSTFRNLFAHREGAFWLDSSSADFPSAQLSPCSSPGSVVRNSSAEALANFPQKRPQGNARFSIMGACVGPMSELITYNVTQRVVTIHRPCSECPYDVNETQWEGCIFDYLKEQLAMRYAPAPPHLPCEMNGGYVGYFGYELKRDTLGVQSNAHVSTMPDAWFIFADRLLLFDHLEGDVYLIALQTQGDESQRHAAELWFDRTDAVLMKSSQLDEEANDDFLVRKSMAESPKEVSPLKFIPERHRSDYLMDIAQSQGKIRCGESYEICLTNRLRTKLPDGIPINALNLYSKLRKLNAAPYAAFLQVSEDEAVCCSSPERFLIIGSDGRVESKPIKGTRSRGRSFTEDELLRSELQQSKKDRSENLMIVDLVRNDLSRTCGVGTVKVPKLMHVESYATVHQLVSNVTGCLRKEHDVVDCVRAAFPMGSMTGAPKIRTMEMIDSLERSPRGVYSGTIGYLSVCGGADLNVVIRTAVVHKDSVDIGVGGAIIGMSSPEDEYDEAILKGSAIMQAVALYSTGCSDGYFVEHERTIGG